MNTGISAANTIPNLSFGGSNELNVGSNANQNPNSASNNQFSSSSNTDKSTETNGINFNTNVGGSSQGGFINAGLSGNSNQTD